MADRVEPVPKSLTEDRQRGRAKLQVAQGADGDRAASAFPLRTSQIRNQATERLQPSAIRKDVRETDRSHDEHQLRLFVTENPKPPI